MYALKPKHNADHDNEKELQLLQEKLGITKNISPDQLKNALKNLVNDKVISDFKIKHEK
jgi:DNA-binding Lrp family transcriptional regulator